VIAGKRVERSQRLTGQAITALQLDNPACRWHQVD